MSDRAPHKPLQQDVLSALSDGGATRQEVGEVLTAWAHDPEVRASWHRYQMIGDLLRSPEALKGTSDGELFLQRLRVRLASEAVVMAPQAAAEVQASQAAGLATLAPPVVLRRRMWAGPAAVAACFVAVVGVLSGGFTGLQQPNEGGAQWAQMDAAGAMAALAPRDLALALSQPSFSHQRSRSVSQVLRDPAIEQVVSGQPVGLGVAVQADPRNVVRQAVFSAP